MMDRPMTMTADEVARELQIPRNSVYDLAAKGVIPSIRLRNTVRFSRRAIERLVEGEQHEGAGEAS